MTDLQLRQELDKVIRAHDPGGRGLHDLWFIFLPPDVDTCLAIGTCGTTAYAGYHALANTGTTPTIYAAIPDPLIEFTPPPGQDPQGNPEAEVTIDTVAHEAVEAITDPLGTGWMDPNGFEVADKCETPQIGTPLGYADDGSPYNQLINGHQYLIQAMWSNVVRGCVLTGHGAGSGLPLQTVNLRQFSSSVSGSTTVKKAGIEVLVAVGRANHLVALGTGSTRSDGSWGPVTLRSPSGALHGSRRRPRPDPGRLPLRRAEAELDPDRQRRQPVHRDRVHRLVRARPRLRGSFKLGAARTVRPDRGALADGRGRGDVAAGRPVRYRERRRDGGDPAAERGHERSR